MVRNRVVTSVRKLRALLSLFTGLYLGHFRLSHFRINLFILQLCPSHLDTIPDTHNSNEGRFIWFTMCTSFSVEPAGSKEEWCGGEASQRRNSHSREAGSRIMQGVGKRDPGHSPRNPHLLASPSLQQQVSWKPCVMD